MSFEEVVEKLRQREAGQQPQPTPPAQPTDVKTPAAAAPSPATVPTGQPEPKPEPVQEPTEPQQVAEPTGEEPPEDSMIPKKKSGYQKRIDELVAEREHWRQLAEGVISGRQPTQPQPQPPPQPQGYVASVPNYQGPAYPVPKPKFEDFLSSPNPEAQLAEALVDWKDAKRTFESGWMQHLEQQNQQFVERQKKVVSWAEQGKRKIDDFDSAANDTFTLSPVMGEELMESEVGHELFYYFHQNHGEAQRISGLSAPQQRRAIFELEQRYKTELAKVKAEAELAAKQTKTATKVESPGTGAQVTKPELAQLIEKARKTGDLRDWGEVLRVKGF